MRMNREEEIQAIKQNIKIEDLADYFGLKLKAKRGRRIAYYSPSDPSYELVVYPKDNRYIDYGNAERGSVIDFYMCMTNKSYAETMKDLRKMLFGNGEVKNTYINKIPNYEKITITLNDFKMAEKEFQEVVRLYISKSKNKTKYLKELRKFLKDLKNKIAKEEFDLII